VKSVEGIYRNGKVELVEPLAEAEGSRVIVTWVHPGEPIGLRERGIDESHAADLRRRLAPLAEDWDRPEMAAYDELPPRGDVVLVPLGGPAGLLVHSQQYRGTFE